MITKGTTFNGIENVTVVKFGTGDIMVASAKVTDQKVAIMSFKQCEPRPIGTEDPDSIGKTLDEYGTDVVILFDNIDSIEVVMRSLIECRKNLQP